MEEITVPLEAGTPKMNVQIESRSNCRGRLKMSPEEVLAFYNVFEISFYFNGLDNLILDTVKLMFKAIKKN